MADRDVRFEPSIAIIDLHASALRTSRFDVWRFPGQHVEVEDTVRVRCPYCREWVDFYVDPDTTGTLVEDCAVCCRPWTVLVERDTGRLRVHLSRAQ